MLCETKLIVMMFKCLTRNLIVFAAEAPAVAVVIPPNDMFPKSGWFVQNLLLR